MSIKFKKEINSLGETKLRWDTGSYNTYYFDNKEEFEENKNELETIHHDYSIWTDKFGSLCLQILQ